MNLPERDKNPQPTSRIESSILRAVRVLKSGGIAAIPTDTVYGLAARALDRTAVDRVFRLKRRDVNAPLPLLLYCSDMMDMCALSPSRDVLTLAEAFWPGPLTIVVPKSKQIPSNVTGKRLTVGLRVPDHPFPRALSKKLNEPITGTSANRTGNPPFTTMSKLNAEMASELDYVADAGELPIRPPSTVIDMSGDKPKILRAGGVSQQSIESALGFRV